ncbi:MAG: ATP-binding protein [Terriglobales bacterium]
MRVVVADNGKGIATEHLPNLFEPFFTTKGENGTGLGLWVAQRIVEKLGGLIRVRSRVGKAPSGTVFSVFLPMAAMQAGAGAQAGSSPAAGQEQAGDERAA